MGFKENLKMLRKSKEMTQEEFGKLINKSKLTIIRYENGETFPSFETLKEICNFFNIEVSDIVMNITYEKKKYTFEEILKLLYSKKHELAHIEIDFNKISSEKEKNENKNNANFTIDKENLINNTQKFYELFSSHVSESFKQRIWEEVEKELNIENRREKHRAYSKISKDILEILKTDVKEYFKIYSGKNLTSEEIKKLHEDILKYTMFLLSELAAQK